MSTVFGYSTETMHGSTHVTNPDQGTKYHTHTHTHLPHIRPLPRNLHGVRGVEWEEEEKEEGEGAGPKGPVAHLNATPGSERGLKFFNLEKKGTLPLPHILFRKKKTQIDYWSD